MTEIGSRVVFSGTSVFGVLAEDKCSIFPMLVQPPTTMFFKQTNELRTREIQARNHFLILSVLLAVSQILTRKTPAREAQAEKLRILSVSIDKTLPLNFAVSRQCNKSH